MEAIYSSSHMDRLLRIAGVISIVYAVWKAVPFGLADIRYELGFRHKLPRLRRSY